MPYTVYELPELFTSGIAAGVADVTLEEWSMMSSRVTEGCLELELVDGSGEVPMEHVGNGFEVKHSLHLSTLFMPL